MQSPSPADASRVACLVLAAGAAERFGGCKQLAELGGRPLLEHALGAANGSPVERVVAVLGARADEVLAHVDLGRAEPLVCEAWREGMAAPLRAGIEAVADADAAVILLGDQPLVTAAAVGRVLAAHAPGQVAVRATYDGAPGHPVLIERALFGEIATLRGDAGARVLLDRPDVATVACDDTGDPLDVDTPADLARAEALLAG